MSPHRIGVFDSGVGGLTIYRRFLEELPQYDYVYYGDTAHVPYGDRSEEEIYELTRLAVDALFREHDCLLVILACNTASAVALRRLQQEYLPENFPERRVLGIVRPTVEYVAEQPWRKVVLIGTTATVRSGAYPAELHKVAPRIEIEQLATPQLVPLIEAEEWGELEQQLETLSQEINQQNWDALLLGCTHYELVQERIQRRFSFPVVSQGRLVTNKLLLYLTSHPELEKQLQKNFRRQELYT